MSSQRERRRILALAAATVVMASSCTVVGSDPLPTGELALGTWGGDGAGMIVSDTAMHLHVGCTFGDVSGRIALNPAGGFDVPGSYTLRAYPVTVGPSLPARFKGQRVRDVVTITVTVDDTVEHQTVVKGPVTLTYGRDPQMGPCPICRRPVFTRRATHH